MAGSDRKGLAPPQHKHRQRSNSAAPKTATPVIRIRLPSGQVESLPPGTKIVIDDISNPRLTFEEQRDGAVVMGASPERPTNNISPQPPATTSTLPQTNHRSMFERQGNQPPKRRIAPDDSYVDLDPKPISTPKRKKPSRQSSVSLKEVELTNILNNDDDDDDDMQTAATPPTHVPPSEDDFSSTPLLFIQPTTSKSSPDLPSLAQPWHKRKKPTTLVTRPRTPRVMPSPEPDGNTADQTNAPLSYKEAREVIKQHFKNKKDKKLNAKNSSGDDMDLARAIEQATLEHQRNSATFQAILPPKNDADATTGLLDPTDETVSKSYHSLNNVADVIAQIQPNGAHVIPPSKLELALAWAKKTAWATVEQFIINPYNAFKEHPGYAVLAFLFSLSTVIFSLAYGFNCKPADLLTKLSGASTGEVFNALWFAWSSLSTNVAMNYWFVEGLKNDYADVKKIWSSGAVGKISIFSAVVVGALAAVAAGAVGMSSFAFIPGPNVLLGMLNAVITLISRFNGFLRLINRGINAYNDMNDPDIERKTRAADILSHLTPAFKQHLNDLFTHNPDWSKPTKSFDTLANIFAEIEKAENSGKKPIDEDGITSTNRKRTGRKVAQALFAFIIAELTYETFTEKGWAGIEAVLLKFSDISGIKIDTEKWSNGAKIATGTLPGVASALFYFVHIYDFLDSVLGDTFELLAREPERIPSMLGILVHTIFSGSSLYNIAVSISNADKNLFGDVPGNWRTVAKEDAHWATGTIINTKVIDAKIVATAKAAVPPSIPLKVRNVDDCPRLIESLPTKHLPPSVAASVKDFTIFDTRKTKSNEGTSILLPDPSRVIGPGYI